MKKENVNRNRISEKGGTTVTVLGQVLRFAFDLKSKRHQMFIWVLEILMKI